MATIWEAPADIAALVRRLKEEHHHPRLAHASIWVLLKDSNHISDNRVVTSITQKCTKTEKLSSGHDFKITLLPSSWEMLTNKQREIAIDEALCRCDVKYEPRMLEINGKKEPVKDDMGRKVFTDQIDYDNEGKPKWKLAKPDAGIFFPLIRWYGDYCEELENLHRVTEGKPLATADATPMLDEISA